MNAMMQHTTKSHPEAVSKNFDISLQGQNSDLTNFFKNFFIFLLDIVSMPCYLPVNHKAQEVQ